MNVPMSGLDNNCASKSLLKRMAKFEHRLSLPKRNSIKRIAAGLLIRPVHWLIDGYESFLYRLNLIKREDVQRLAIKIAGNSEPQFKAASICRFVHQAVVNGPKTKWRNAEAVLARGIGDCKNQATLLWEMLLAVRIESKIIIGLTHLDQQKPKIHAWVQIPIGSEILIGDTTQSSVLYKQADYYVISGGIVDLTDEYRQKIAVQNKVCMGFSNLGGKK